MTFVPGRTVAELWPTASEELRQDIVHQLHQFVQQLQRLKAPHAGPVGGDISRAKIFGLYNAGPFHTIQDIEAWLDGRLRVCKRPQHAPASAPRFAGCFEELVVCHLDLAARNLILDPQGRLWVLDWGKAGGYPPVFKRVAVSGGREEELGEGLRALMGGGEGMEGRIWGLGYAVTTGSWAVVDEEPEEQGDESWWAGGEGWVLA